MLTLNVIYINYIVFCVFNKKREDQAFKFLFIINFFLTKATSMGADFITETI
jgi:hypothetical protein